MPKLHLFIVLLSTTFAVNFAQNLTQNQCISKRICSDCIAQKGCAWCLEPNLGDEPLCFQPNWNSVGSCPEEYTYFPDNEQTLIVAKPSTNDVNAFGVPQIYPQRVNLKLRPNEPYRLEVRYTQNNFPIDLYYLMDLSMSNEDYNKKLSLLGVQLSESMQRFTSNFRLGFGIFHQDLSNATVLKNYMTLGNNDVEFTSHVEQVVANGNYSAADKGGLDALVQALVCNENIGWRAETRRLLVFASDSDFRYSNDGKVVAPNDAECHMNTDGEYTRSSTVDFPSTSQINSKAMENSINIIFAVAPQQMDVYGKLSRQIEGSSIATLSEDSSNVVELVRNHYNTISTSVKMQNTASSAVGIKYYSSCLRHGDPFETSTCDGLRAGDMVNFHAEVLVTECPTDPKDWFQTFQIYPVGINESLTVDLEMRCSCPL